MAVFLMGVVLWFVMRRTADATARDRRSVRRHARLVDYAMHDGREATIESYGAEVIGAV